MCVCVSLSLHYMYIKDSIDVLFGYIRARVLVIHKMHALHIFLLSALSRDRRNLLKCGKIDMTEEDPVFKTI